MSTALPKRHKVIVHLIRHASSRLIGKNPDPGLSEEGFNQCMSLKPDLDNRSLSEIKNIISSPMMRALDTAHQLFIDTLIKSPGAPGAAKIELWPELQSYRAGGFQEVNTLDLMRKYGIDLLDIRRVVERTGDWISTDDNVKTMKEWLLKKRESVVDEPFEVAVVSHNCVLGNLLPRDAWKGLTWVTCVFNDTNDLVRMPSDEFNDLKFSLAEKKVFQAQKMEEEEDKAREFWKQEFLRRQEQRKNEEKAKTEMRHMDMTRRMLQQYYKMPLCESLKWKALKEQDDARDKSSMDFSLRRHETLANLTKSLNNFPPKARGQQMLQAYMQEWLDKIHVGTSMNDDRYKEKCVEFLGFWLYLIHSVVKGPVLQSPPPTEAPDAFLGPGFDMCLCIHDREREQYILDLKPLIEPSHLTGRTHRHPRLKQIHQEIQMLRGTLSAEEIAATEKAHGYPLLPIMVKVKFGSTWYGGYLPGPEGMEMEAHLCRVSSFGEPVPVPGLPILGNPTNDQADAATPSLNPSQDPTSKKPDMFIFEGQQPMQTIEEPPLPSIQVIIPKPPRRNARKAAHKKGNKTLCLPAPPPHPPPPELDRNLQPLKGTKNSSMLPSVNRSIRF